MTENKEATAGSTSVPSTITSSDIVNETTDTRYLVDYDGLHDLTNPQNWSPLYKWTLVFILSGLTLTVYVWKLNNL